jgi:hypothetical protein
MGPLMTRLIPARPSTGMRSMATASLSAMRVTSSGSSSWPKSSGVPSTAQWVHSAS